MAFSNCHFSKTLNNHRDFIYKDLLAISSRFQTLHSLDKKAILSPLRLPFRHAGCEPGNLNRPSPGQKYFVQSQGDF